MNRDEIELLLTTAADRRQHRLVRALGELLRLRDEVTTLQREVDRLREAGEPVAPVTTLQRELDGLREGGEPVAPPALVRAQAG